MYKHELEEEVKRLQRELNTVQRQKELWQADAEKLEKEIKDVRDRERTVLLNLISQSYAKPVFQKSDKHESGGFVSPIIDAKSQEDFNKEWR